MGGGGGGKGYLIRFFSSTTEVGCWSSGYSTCREPRRSEFESQQITSAVFATPKFFFKKTLSNIEVNFSEKQMPYIILKLLFEEEKNTICSIEVEFQKI